MKIFWLILFFSFFAVGKTSAQNAEKSEQDCEAEKAKILRYESQLQDWANLKRYREENAKLQAASKNEPRVVFMGDSITDGWNLAEYFPGKPYINRGIGGQTTPQMLLRFRPDVINLKPRLVVILAGTNDISGNTGPMTAEETANNLVSMVELARANDIGVVLSSILPVSDRVKNKQGELFIQTKSRPNEKIRAINDWMKKYAADNDIVYLDYYSATIDEKGTLKDGLSYDGLHPDRNGYKLMQSLAEAAIEQALKKEIK
jgi:lysophospholipase L1-like esterase